MIQKVRALLGTKYGRIAKRVLTVAVAAFVAAFGVAAGASHLYDPANITNLELWKAAAFSGWTAALLAAVTLIQSLVTQYFTGQPTVTAAVRGKADNHAAKVAARRQSRHGVR